MWSGGHQDRKIGKAGTKTEVVIVGTRVGLCWELQSHCLPEHGDIGVKVYVFYHVLYSVMMTQTRFAWLPHEDADL